MNSLSISVREEIDRYPCTMSTLEECRKIFRQELRQYALLQANGTTVTDLNRHHRRLRDLLGDVQRSIIATLSTTAAAASSTHVAKGALDNSQHSRTGKAPQKRGTLATLTLPVAHQYRGNALVSSVSAAKVSESASYISLAQPPRRRSRLLGVDIAISLAEECVSAANFLVSRGLFEDAVELCLKSIEKDSIGILRDMAAVVESRATVVEVVEQSLFQTMLRCETPGSGASEGSRLTGHTTEDDDQGRLMAAFQLICQYDLLLHTSQFHLALEADPLLEDRSNTFGRAAEHLELILSCLASIASVNADADYFTLYNGTVTVYELCQHMLRRAAGNVDDVVPYVVHPIAFCIEVCESVTLKLSTVRYLPWRLRLYESLCSCYEQMGLYAEALSVAQRLVKKVRDLVELEYMDKIGPANESKEMLLNVLRSGYLTVLRYMWYTECAAREARVAPSGTGAALPAAPVAERGGGSVAEGAQGLNNPATPPIEMPEGVVEAPTSGFEMLNKAWLLVLTVVLVNTDGVDASASTSQSKSAKGKQQQRKQKGRGQEDFSWKEALVGQVRGTLVRFFLSIATSPLSVSVVTSGPSNDGALGTGVSEPTGTVVLPKPRIFLHRYRSWAVAALEFLAHYAVRNYVVGNPSVVEHGLAWEFAGMSAEHFRQHSGPVGELPVGKPGTKKGGATRRKGHGAVVSTPEFVITEDENFLKHITIEAFLCELAYPKVLIPSPDVEEDEGRVNSRQAGSLEGLEEGLVMGLLLLCALYDGADAKLYGRFCTCCIHWLQKWLGEEDGETGRCAIMRDVTVGNWKALVHSSKGTQPRVLDIVLSSVNLLQSMRRLQTAESGGAVASSPCNGSPTTVTIYNVAQVAHKLRQLLEHCTGSSMVRFTQLGQQEDPSLFRVVSPSGSSGNPTTTCGVAAAIGAHQHSLGTTTVVDNCVGVICQRLLEIGADFVCRRVCFFAPSTMSSKGSSSDIIACAGVEDEHLLDQDPVELYHSAVTVCLEAKANSGLTDAIGFGELVLFYAKDVVSEVSRSFDKGAGCVEKPLKGGALPQNRFLLDYASLLRKKHRHASMALAAIGAALKWLCKPRPRPGKRTPGNIVKLGASGAAEPTSPGMGMGWDAAQGVSDTGKLYREQEMRDMRTDLMRWKIELSWHASLYWNSFTALEKHMANVKLIKERHANEKVYGVVTAKDRALLEAYLHAEPELLHGNEGERRRLIAWARQKGDPLLHALVLLSLAAYQAPKTQREMLEESFQLLWRFECRTAQNQSLTISFNSTQQPKEGTLYSPLMIWCDVMTTCGRLGFTEMADRARNVLQASFMSKKRSEILDGDATTRNVVDRSPGVTLNATHQEGTFVTRRDSLSSGNAVNLEVQPSDVLSLASPLQLRTLVSAIRCMSIADMRSCPYKSFEIAGLMPLAEQSFMSGVPFEGRYALSETQMVYIRSAYRIQFAMELANRVNDNENMMQCAFDLFNALLPLLVDGNLCTAVLQPLSTLCGALLRQPVSYWSDANTQLLAARTIAGLLKTLHKMTSTLFDANTLELTAPRAANSPWLVSNDNVKPLLTYPTTVSGWYELLIRVFVYVWNQVFAHPNVRQIRHMQRVRREASRALAALSSVGGSNIGVVPPTASSGITPRKGSERRRRASIAGSAAVGAAPAAECVDGNPAFPGSAYLTFDTLIDDCFPIEYVELLGEVLFTVPATILNTVFKVPPREKAADVPATSAASGCTLAGVPQWLLELPIVLATKVASNACEMLLQASGSPLCPRAAVYVVRYLLQQGDMACARRLATDVLDRMQKLHEGIQEYQQIVMDRVNLWLHEEGYTLPQPNGNTQGDAPLVERKNVTGARVRVAGAPEVSAGDDVSSTGMKEATEQMARDPREEYEQLVNVVARQLTRGYARIRRRQMLRWLRGRVMQFNAPFAAMLHLHLQSISLSILEQQQRLRKKGRSGLPDGFGKSVTHSRTSSLDDCITVNAANETINMKRGIGDQSGSESDEEGLFMKHAVHAATLFNRCSLLTQSFAAVTRAIDGIRMLVCEEPPDLRLPMEKFYQKGEGSPHVLQRVVSLTEYGSDACPTIPNAEVGRLIDCLLVPQHYAPAHAVAPLTCEKLAAWSPNILLLAQAMSTVLSLLWDGHVDYRRDVDFVQPAAVKVGRDVLLGEQLCFQGRIPSLYSFVSAAGQYEEARLSHYSSLESRHLMRLTVWRIREVRSEEKICRIAVRKQWMMDLQAIVDQFEKLLELKEHREYLKKQCIVLQQQEEEERCAWAQFQEQWDVEAVAMRRGGMGANAKGTLPVPINTDGPDGLELAARRFGYALPVDKVVRGLLFLLRCMQFNCQIPALEIAEYVHELTGGFFMSQLLPIIMQMQKRVGRKWSDKAIESLLLWARDEPMQRRLVRSARVAWDQYRTTDAYRRAMQRLGRTLKPSKGASDTSSELMWEAASVTGGSATEAVHPEEDGGNGNGNSSLPPPTRSNSPVADSDAPNAASTTEARSSSTFAACAFHRVSLRDVISKFEAVTTHLRQRRLFGLLAEELYELGRIHLLHRQRGEAERCWLDAVDAALEVPESLHRFSEVSARAEFSASGIGLPRILLAILALTSLAMYSYRDQQKRAVDACLLSARLLECLLKECSSSSFPRHLRDFGSFLLEDIILLPHLGESLSALMPLIVHHLLFLGQELLRFKFPIYTSLVASITEYFARTYTRHIELTIEARLLQARAAAYSSCHGVSMRILRDVCQGKRIPSVVMGSVDLLVDVVDTVRSGRGQKRGDAPQTSSKRQAEAQMEPQQTPAQQQLQPQPLPPPQSLSILYNDSEFPTSAANVACIQTFVNQCFFVTGGEGPSSPNPPPATPSSTPFFTLGALTGGLQDTVSTVYGPSLSLRVELTVAESLVALGSKESAYVWNVLMTGSQGVSLPALGWSGLSVDRRGGRGRSTQRGPSHPFANSACREALNAAEQIIQGILARSKQRHAHLRQKFQSLSNVVEVPSSSVYVKKNQSKERNAPAAPQLGGDSSVRRWVEVERTYIMCTADLLLAKIHTARGDCLKALGLLQSLVKSFNENSEGFACCAPHVPSYLWTVGTHTFWCEVHELMVLNHMRLLEHNTAQRVIDHALALCDQCGDPYSGRAFSLARAAIAARSGSIGEAEKILKNLLHVSGSLGSDNRIDLLRAWVSLAIESLQREDHQRQKQKQIPPSEEILEGAVLALHEYSEAHGLRCLGLDLPKTKPPTGPVEVIRAAKKEQKCRFTLLQSPQRVVWGTEAVFLHRAVNALADEYVRLGQFKQAEELLRCAIHSLAPQYDTAVHPTQLVGSRFALARVLCLQDPSLISPVPLSQTRTQQRRQGLNNATEDAASLAFLQDTATDEDVIAALDLPRQYPVRLLLSVIEHSVVGGIHDYNVLRFALLLLASILSHAGRAFHVMAANCIVLAKLVVDMKFHVFSGTSVFSLYGDDSIVLGTEIVLAENIVAHILSIQRNQGHFVFREPSERENPSAPAGLQQSQPRSREERDKTAQAKCTVSLPVVVSAFAALHRERSLDFLLPPQECLALETAIQHIRAFLQVRTAILSCGYLWYNETAREAYIKQQQSGQGRVGDNSRTPRNNGATPQPDGTMTVPPILLPPIVIDSMPSLFSPFTLQNLSVPRVNAVFCHSLLCDAGVEYKHAHTHKSQRSTAAESRRQERLGATLSATGVPTKTEVSVKFILCISPVNDMSITQPPSLNEKGHQAIGKKNPRANPRNVSSVTADQVRGTDMNAAVPSWNEVLSVAFDVPIAKVRELHNQATHTLLLMQSPSVAPPASNTAGATVDDDDASVTTLLSQQLNETLSVLMAKLTPANASKKVVRLPLTVDALLSGSSGVSNSTSNAITQGAGATHAALPSARQVASGQGTRGDKSVTGTHGAENKIVDASAGAEVTALDEAKSKLITDFIQMVVVSIVPRTIADDYLMDRYVRMLMPQCTITIDLIRFLVSITTSDGDGISLFNPGIHEWFTRITNFVLDNTN
ncbi:hypothetical protein TRVL_03956 [Trypanosoma vivax]|nr:hypothetical protein TRVL_03956 [Trypanosoma vivax]